MKNDLGEIVWQIGAYESDLKMNYNGTLEDIEIECVYSTAEKLLNELGEIERFDEVKKAMVNMYFSGKLRSIKNT
jgi:hypothetical protein